MTETGKKTNITLLARKKIKTINLVYVINALSLGLLISPTTVPKVGEDKSCQV